MERSVVVIGQGFVGGSLSQVLVENGVGVYAFDKARVLAKGANCEVDARAKTGHLISVRPGSSSEMVGLCYKNVDGFTGIAFVCLPTPMRKDGSCDTSIVEGTLRELAQSYPNQGEPLIAVVKSTVPPGSTERWNKQFEGTGLIVVHSPEFLREATALEDMRNQDRIILGGPRPHVDRVRDLFRFAFPRVPIHKTSSSISEMVKYTANCFLALKVSFANEMYQVVDALQKQGCDIDYDRMVELATLDERLGKSHWKVPGPMPANNGSGELRAGYSGSCFVKDCNSLIFIARQLGVDPKVNEGGWQKNLEVRPQRDWERLTGRAVSQDDDDM